jgi:hypothetical protein
MEIRADKNVEVNETMRVRIVIPTTSGFKDTMSWIA